MRTGASAAEASPGSPVPSATAAPAGSIHGVSSGSMRTTSDRSHVTSPPLRRRMVAVSSVRTTLDADITRPLDSTTRSARAGAATSASPAVRPSARGRREKVISLYFGSTKAWNTLTPNSLKS